MKRAMLKSAAVAAGVIMLVELAVLLTPQMVLIGAFSR